MCLQNVCYPSHNTSHPSASYSHLQSCIKTWRVAAEMCHRRRTRKSQWAASGLGQEQRRHSETGQLYRDGHHDSLPLSKGTFVQWARIMASKTSLFFMLCLRKLPINDHFLTSCKNFSCTSSCNTSPIYSPHILWKTVFPGLLGVGFLVWFLFFSIFHFMLSCGAFVVLSWKTAYLKGRFSW